MHRTPPSGDEAFWRDFLTRGDSLERKLRGVLKAVPHSPRCKLCAAPFEGPGAPVMRAIGKRRSDKNPSMCNSCFEFIVRHHGGAEIEASFLFADVRGSTAMAERMSAGDFRATLNRFYDTASHVVVDHDGSIDKFIGDEVMAMFFPLLSGPDHVGRAVEAGRSLLVATGHGSTDGPWIPLGAGVHWGRAWVGAIGEGAHTELTAVGDVVNTTARLAAVAKAGEILVTASAADAAHLAADLPRRELELKGKQARTEVVSLLVA